MIGNWLDKYVQRFSKKYSNNKITKEKYDSAMDFAKRKRISCKKVIEEYQKKSNEEKEKQEKRIAELKELISSAAYKIAEGKLKTLNLKDIDFEEKQDMMQNAVITIMQYLNRFDTDLNSSIFAFMTSTANNSFKMTKNDIYDWNTRTRARLDYYDNLDGGIENKIGKCEIEE
jgi:anti-sigma28 factor (negative regulator of flagellin synthesis)